MKDKMKDLLEWRKNEQLDEKNFKLFILEVAKQAKHFQQERGPYHDGTLPDDLLNSATLIEKGNPLRLKKSASQKQASTGSEKHASSTSEGTYQGMKRKGLDEAPLRCLNEICRTKGRTSFVIYCPKSSDALKMSFATNRERKDGENGQFSKTQNKSNPCPKN